MASDRLFEGDPVDEHALENLVRAAIEYSRSKLRKKAPTVSHAKLHKRKK